MHATCLTLRSVKTEQTGLAPEFIRELRDRFALTSFIESGTYQGATTAIAASLFDDVHTIELAPALHAKAAAKFASLKHVHTHFGDSARLLPEILRNGPRERILFWLDGHYSGGPTAKGETNTPILDEVRALATAGVRNSVVLIDDLRIFERTSAATDASLAGYPTVAELRDALRSVFPQLAFAHFGDIAVAFDATAGPEFSPVVSACTASRLYDAEHAPADEKGVTEVLDEERVIASATGSEAKALLNLAAAYPSAEKHGLGGHYHLWAALVMTGQNGHRVALQHFQRAQDLGCRHWRLDCYLATSLGAFGERAEALLALNEARRVAPDHPLVAATQQALLGKSQARSGSSDVAPAFGVPIEAPPAAHLQSNGEQAVLRRFINAESIVFDVGAHRGDWSAAVLQHCAPRQLHLFEPLPEQFHSLLTRFADGFRTGRIHANPSALSDREELREFHHYPQSPTWSTFHRRAEAERAHGVAPPQSLRVPTTTLDNCCERTGVRRIGFLKLDVEGAELEVLRGARRLLHRGDIDFIQFEYGGTYTDAGTTLREVFEFLQQFNCELFRITPQGLTHCAQFTASLEDFQYANYLVAHPRVRAPLLGEKPQMLDLDALARQHNVKPRGVIHIGAHEGKECARYRAMGFQKILFIEANPAVFARLQANVAGQPGVILAQCAVSNTCGTAPFRVTSMDQSSSLLPLKRHKALYPDIVETQSFEVRTVTLDQLLGELSLDPADFNFLNLDIQGAELLALQGAQEALTHIEAINTEVNFEELYEGCARLEDIDAFLEQQGFRRAAVTTPFHPSWGDAFYVRQPVVTMSSLGRNGRFANQLFQYAFLKCYAREHDLRVETPPWVGQKLFGSQDAPISRRLPEVRERSNLLAEALVPSGRAEVTPLAASPLTPALSPLRGEGARQTSLPNLARSAALVVAATSDGIFRPRRRALPSQRGRDASPSPLNGERAGVRSETEASARNIPPPYVNVDFWGYFQYHSSYYAPSRDYFRSLFQPTPQTLALVEPMLERLRQRGRTIVGLHLRRGDYGYEHFFVAPSEWYLEWLRGLWSTLAQPVLFIASDEPGKVLADFAEFQPVTARDLGAALPGADFYPDFFLLSHCDVLAISNSSFSFAAAMLNERATIFARPHLPTQKLIPFDPWNSEVIFRDAKVSLTTVRAGESEKTSTAPDQTCRSGPSPQRKVFLPLPRGGGEGRGEGALPSPKTAATSPAQTINTEARLEAHPTFSFVTIVLNGMPFLEFALRAVYDFAHEIVIVEGAVEKCRFAANPDGSSTDGTVECIRSFPDPDGKIRIIQGTWSEKCEMQNEALKHVTGDFVWLMDADEIYRRADLDQVRQLVQQDPTITQINFIPDNFWKGFDQLFVSSRFLEPAAHYRRVFKSAPGARFTSHRPPTLMHSGSKLTTEQQHCIPGDVTRAMGIVPFHYSYVVESQVAQKIDLYNRYGWGKGWKLDLNEWMRECWQKWTPENRAEIEKKYPVWTGGESHTEPFTGDHPEVMHEFIARWRSNGGGVPASPRPLSTAPTPQPKRQQTGALQILAEDHLLPVIGHKRYLRLVLEAWQHIELDAPLLKRRAVIEQHLRDGTPFWNNHVGLAFLADRLKPGSYLEIGVRTGGSFVQALNRAPLREAVALDLWSGSYSDLPNTREFTAAQIERFLSAHRRTGFQPVLTNTATTVASNSAETFQGRQDACPTGQIELRQGNSHVELKKLIAEGRRFDLINVDGDHADAGALEDLEDALKLLSPRGAILFDDVIHPGFRSLLGVVKQFAAAHPELQLLLNTTQDNGVAILLKGLRWEELAADCASVASAPSRRIKIAGEHATKADLTQIDAKSAFAQAIRKLFAENRPKHVIETGTYLGTGTTQVIASAIQELKLKGTRFDSIEVKPEHFQAASRNLAARGLAKCVRLHHGLSVPRRLLPTLEQIEEMTVRNIGFDDIFVDHREHERARLYFQETDSAGLPEDLLGQCVRRCGGRPDFVLLDSAGHVGHIEFNYLIELLAGPCLIALDDVHHIKHAASLRQMRGDPRFEILVESGEKFGFCIAKFTPEPIPVEADVKRLLWVRTDSVGDAVLAASMLPHVRRRFSNARIAVLCQERLAELYTACPLVETIVCFDPKKVADDAEYRQSIVNEIAAFQPDLVLNSIYSRDAVTELLTHSARAPRTIGIAGNVGNISRAEHEKAQSLYTQLIPSPGTQTSELERHRDFLAGLGAKVARLEPTVWTSPEDEALAQAYFEQEKLDPARTVALFPGAQHERRVYPQLAQALQGFHGAQFLIFGGVEVAAAGDALAGQLPGVSINLCGKTTLREMAALIRKCRLFVGTESAGAHIACAVGVPNVVIIGGGHFGRFMPWSPLTSLAGLPLDCFGCNWQCRFTSPHCVKDIAPEVVAEAIRRTLEGPSERPRFFAQASAAWPSKAGLPSWCDARSWLGSTDVEIVPVEVAPASGDKAPPAPLPEAVADLVRQADQHFAAGRLADATTALVRAAATAPDHADLQIALANLHFQQGHLPLAHEALHRATQIQPDDATTHVLLANVCLRRQKIEAFEAALGRALQIDPNHPQGVRLLADLNFQHGRYADAARGYAMIAQQEPHNLDVLLALGRCFVEAGEWEAARASYEEVLKFDPLHTVAAENLQVVQAKQQAAPAHPSESTASALPTTSEGESVADGTTPTELRHDPDASRRNPVGVENPFPPVSQGSACLVTLGCVPETLWDSDECTTKPAGTSTSTALLVTAIVSTYNAERFMRGCLEDLEAQTIADRLEIIVIDSGSEQNERAIVEEFQRRYGNIVYLRTERESLYAAWNRAIAMARGTYLTNANADDRHRPDAYALLARALDEHPVGIVYADSLNTRIENETLATTRATRRFEWPEFTLKELLLRNYFGPHPMWRRSVHREVGLFNPEFNIAGDYDFNLRVAARFGAKRVPEVLGLYLEGGLEWRNRQQCVEETRRLLRHHRRAIAIEDVCPELRQPDLPAQAKARLLVDYAAALSKTWHPDPELAREILQCAARLTPDSRTGFQPVPVDSAPVNPAATVPPDNPQHQSGAVLLPRYTGLQSAASRAASPPTPSTKICAASATDTPNTDRQDACPTGYSFCLITNGKRPETLRAELDSLRALKIPQCEILVGGDVPPGLGDDVTVVPLSEAAQAGRLGEMRNRLIERARFDTLVVADDDMLFHADFHQGIEKFGPGFDVLCVRLLNSDGTRFWDWATVGGPRGQCVLDYDETDPFLYVTGGLCVMKSAVAARVRWDDQRGFYQAEDVDFSRRLQREGFRISFNPHSTVTHNDSRYTLDGLVVVRVDGAFRLAREDYQAGRRLLGRHRLERAVRLWPGADTKQEVDRIAREFGDDASCRPDFSVPIDACKPAPVSNDGFQTAPASAVAQAAQPAVSPAASRRDPTLANAPEHAHIPPFELKLPVRWVAPVFSSAAAARAALEFVQPLASRVWLGVLHHGAEYSDSVVERLPAADREILFALADRLPAMLGGVGISQAAPEALAKLPGATRHVGFLCGVPKKLQRKQAACCAQMDELWVSRPRDASALKSAGVAPDKVHLVTNVDQVFSRLQAIEALLLQRWADALARPGLSPVSGDPPARTGRSPTPSSPARVAWEGSFLDLGSLSHVNRALTTELAKRPGVQLACIGRNALSKELPGMPELKEFARRLQPQPSPGTQVTVRHAWPPNWQPPKSGAWVLIQPWEFGSLPADWLQPLARVDEVWVPSEHVRRCYVDSGVDPRKVHVVPNGIDPDRFRPDAKPLPLATRKKFKFLFVGGTIHRKGPDLLLRAYLESFTAAADVCLVIKDFGGQGVYAGQTLDAQIRGAKSRADSPEILHLTDDIPVEDMPGLYTACDGLVHPYRGEGFGLPVLEAMACGLSVVVTGGGATDDFATDEFAFRLPAQRKEFGHSVSGMRLAKNGWLLEPDYGSLVERLKWIVTHRDEAQAKGRAASEHVRRQWTWVRAAQVAARRLSEIVERRAAEPTAKSPRRPKPIELPPCARLGHLSEAREWLQQGKLLPAWNATAAAVQARPFHPEALHLLADVARAAGDADRAADLTQRARQMAPGWNAAKHIRKSPPGRDTAKAALPDIPRASRRTPHAPRLTVCLIAKNEERFIGQCLESIRPLADQIVVVDTGSTDWTTTIASRFGAEVHTFEWRDDFSAARNVALEKATGDWVLMLDADEELPPDQHDRLLKLLRDPKAIAYRLPIRDEGREAEGVSYVPRLFRNAPGLFYVGRVHEQVFSSIEVRRAEWGLENKLGDATLLHHGYTPELMESRDKLARNLRLLELAVEELPGDPNLLLNLGLELVRAGRPHEGLDQYAASCAALSALPKEQVVPELRESLLTQFSAHLLSAKRPAEIVRILNSPLARTGGLTASMHWWLGLAHIELKQFAEGAAQMRECLAKRHQPVLTPIQKDIRKAGPHHCLALCLAALKQADAADQAFLAALQDDAKARPVRFDYARFLAGTGRAAEALKWLHQLMAENPADPSVWLLGGRVALSQPEFLEIARDWTSEAIKLHPQHPGLIDHRAQALLLSGLAAEALPLWRQLATATATPAQLAALILCETCAGPEARRAPPGASGEVNQQVVQWYRRLLAYNASTVILTVNRRLDSLRPIVPEAVALIESALAQAA